MEKLTQKELKEILKYDPGTGNFIRRKSRYGNWRGFVAGCTNGDSYIVIGIKGRTYMAYVLAVLYVEGYLPENLVDHKNRVRNDNRWKNLRETSKTCNARNCNISIKNKSGITGVYWSKQLKKWRAQVMIAKKTLYLGAFKEKIDAAKARWEAEKKYNFPDCNTTSSAFQYLQKHTV